MSVPAIVESRLGDAEVAERVSLGGDDELFVTATGTLIYRADGLLSDESVEEFSHEADRLTVSEGRRKSRIELEYPLEGARSFKVPAGVTDAVVHPVLAGVLSGNGITDPGERVVQTFRFSELTVIVTSKRLVKHIGSAVWDDDYEEFEYESLTGLSFESGSVATQVVLEVDGRQQRIKAPNDQAAVLRERLTSAVFEFHDVDSLEELHEKVGLDDDETTTSSPTVDFGEGVEPLNTGSASDDVSATDSDGGTAAAAVAGTDDDGGAADAEAGGIETTADAETDDGASVDVDTEDGTAVEAGSEDGTTVDSATDDGTAVEAGTDAGEAVDTQTDAERAVDATSAGSDARADEASVSFESSGFEPATASADDSLDERLASLETAVERQTAILERQQGTIEQLIEELRRGR